METSLEEEEGSGMEGWWIMGGKSWGKLMEIKSYLGRFAYRLKSARSPETNDVLE